MIDFVAILRVEKGEETRHGCVAIDQNGHISVYSNSNLVRALQAMFRSSTSLFRTSRAGLQVVKQEVPVTDRHAWLKELRRQLPSPFYGGSVEQSGIQLDQIAKEYKPWPEENTAEYLLQRVGQ